MKEKLRDAASVELCDELKACLGVLPGLDWPTLKHPLLFMVPYASSMAALCNEQLAVRKARVAEAVASKQWSTVLVHHERPYRLNAFAEYSPFMDDEAYWRMLAWLWIDSENIWENKAGWLTFLQSPRSGRSAHLFNAADRARFENLDRVVTVYRGCTERNRRGLSWTTNPQVAARFSRRFADSAPLVLQGTVFKENILAVFTTRGEDEIVIEPRYVHDLTQCPQFPNVNEPLEPASECPFQQAS